MVSTNERANYIASVMKASGVAEPAIMAMIANALGESGDLNPRRAQGSGVLTTDVGYSSMQGYGIWQWTGNINAQQVWQYTRRKDVSEKDMIKDQVRRVLQNNPAQYIPNGRYGWASQSWADFKANKQGRSWKQLTADFMGGFERNAAWGSGVLSVAQAEVNRRVANLEALGGLTFSGGEGIEDGSAGTSEESDWSKLTYEDCLKIMSTGDTKIDKGGGALNWAPIDEYFNQHKGHMRYEQGLRGHVLTDGAYGDCSSFVSYMVELGLGLTDRTLYNTESEHQFLLKNGFELVADGTSNMMEFQNHAGDVIILGAKGTSLGNNGHTVLFRGDNDFYHCTNRPLALNHDQKKDYFPFIPPYFPGNWHWYVYRLKAGAGVSEKSGDGKLIWEGGRLKRTASDKAQHVINLLMSIPGHANGSSWHKSHGIDSAIDGLSVPEAVYVLYRIEGPGYGQTNAGYAGSDSAAADKALERDVNNRYGGSIYNLLKRWGTYSYTGY